MEHEHNDTAGNADPQVEIIHPDVDGMLSVFFEIL
jgi:hypothetical protein